MKKLVLTIATIANNAFVPALTKLGEDNIGARDKYALGRVLREVKSHRETYEEQRVALVKKYGKPNEELLTAKLAALKAMPNPEAVAGQIKQVEAQLAYIAANKVKGWSIDEQDTETMDNFQKELKEMQASTFEVYLDHQVKLPSDTKLSSDEILQLLDIIEEPAAEEPAKK